MLDALTAAIVAAESDPQSAAAAEHASQQRRGRQGERHAGQRSDRRESAPSPDLGEYDVGEPFPGEPRLAAAG